ncbi:hypothetical protein AeMF1_020740 [Aphanomyces euteiches]|nr:hypothetical protein AeMF1_020740 [Aphanomyces euteiches]
MSHKKYLEFVLDVFGKTLSNIVVLIGDNCSTNRALSRLLGIPFVGCASYRFNLFVGDILREKEEIVNLVNDLMRKLKTIILSAKLRRLTNLSPKTRNATRWSSTYAMFQRYMDIKGFLRFLDDREVESMLPTVSQDREISDLLETLDDLNSATVALQDLEISLSDVRDIFDEAIETYPQAIVRLGENSEIVENVDFETAVVKILRGTTSSLSDGQKESVGHLVVSSSIGEGAPLQRLTIAERAKKRQKMSDEGTNYIDCRFIRPTSNICERFFSLAKYALTDRRRGTLPRTFEQQMFLKANASLWAISDVAAIMTNDE